MVSISWVLFFVSLLLFHLMDFFSGLAVAYFNYCSAINF